MFHINSEIQLRVTIAKRKNHNSLIGMIQLSDSHDYLKVKLSHEEIIRLHKYLENHINGTEPKE